MTLAALRAALAHPNVAAFLRLIRERESSQDSSAYTIINGGSHFSAPPWAHPWPDGTPTTRGGKAAGAYQFLPSTWLALVRGYGFADFSPESQDLGAVALIAERGALDDVLAGNLTLAVRKLRPVWTSLPGASESSASWTLAKARAVYEKWGGTVADVEAEQDAAPIEDRSRPYNPEQEAPPEKPMPILALISAFGPLLSTLIPQVATLFKPGSEVAQRNVAAATAVFDTVVKASGQPNIQAAIETMQKDPEMVKAVTQAVVTDPVIIGLLEVGGGIKEARASNLAMQVAEKPFWYNPAFWMSLALLPLVYWIVGSVLVGGTEGAWTIWGRAFNEETRSGTVNLVIGMVLGGIVGIWFGTSYGSMRKTDLAAEAEQRK